MRDEGYILANKQEPKGNEQSGDKMDTTLVSAKDAMYAATVESVDKPGKNVDRGVSFYGSYSI